MDSQPQANPSVLRMAAPLVVSFWMRAVITFIDTIYASLLGDPAVAAVGLTIPFEFLMIAIWVGISTGLTSSLSRAMGADQSERIRQYLQASWRLVILITPLFMLIGAWIWFYAPRLDLAPAVSRNFQIYGSVLLAGSALTSFWSIIPDSLVKAHQDTRSTMWAGIWSNVINVGLNTLFLFVFEWGIFGIAFSTVLGRIGGLVYAIDRARRHERQRLARGAGDTTPDPTPYREILVLAIPSSLTFALMAVESGLVNALLARMRDSTEAIASYSIYYRVVLFALQPVIAIGVAMLPYAARRFGQGDLLGVRRGLREASVASAVYSLVFVGPLMLLAAPWIAAQLAETEISRTYTTFALRLVPLACLSGSLFLLCRPVFEAMHQGRPGLWMAAVRYLVLTGPAAWLGMIIAQQQGQPTLYGLIVALLVVASISSVAFYVWLDRALPDPTA